MKKIYFAVFDRFEGGLGCDLLELPTTKEDIIAHIKNMLRGYCDTSADINHCFGECESAAELNYLATLINTMHTWEDAEPTETLRFYAALQFGKHTGSVKDLINLAQNITCYYMCANVTDEEGLGRFCSEHWDFIDEPDCVPDNILDDFMSGRADSQAYAACGETLVRELDGKFVKGGYIVYEGDIIYRDDFIEYYKGLDDLPEEVKILPAQTDIAKSA
ncbi:hypothetical protein LJC34_01960 [Oscillospiraceae bacterium OttesenSCG-928-G22]|nr:hypothetical protein [Oscillospiraceae bacterium OttesenSCG-928-G22]